METPRLVEIGSRPCHGYNEDWRYLLYSSDALNVNRDTVGFVEEGNRSVDLRDLVFCELLRPMSRFLENGNAATTMAATLEDELGLVLFITRGSDDTQNFVRLCVSVQRYLSRPTLFTPSSLRTSHNAERPVFSCSDCRQLEQPIAAIPLSRLLSELEYLFSGNNCVYSDHFVL